MGTQALSWQEEEWVVMENMVLSPPGLQRLLGIQADSACVCVCESVASPGKDELFGTDLLLGSF